VRRTRPDESENVRKIGVAHVLKCVGRHEFRNARTIWLHTMAYGAIEIPIRKGSGQLREVAGPHTEIRNECAFQIRAMAIGAAIRMRKTISARNRRRAL
jgi:hypothetical protein